jgi:hypothetical protein
MRELQEVQGELGEEGVGGLGSAYSSMTESRVERLLRLAEESAVAGDSDKTESILLVLAPAIYLQRLEVKALRKMAKVAVADE